MKLPKKWLVSTILVALLVFGFVVFKFEQAVAPTLAPTLAPTFDEPVIEKPAAVAPTPAALAGIDNPDSPEVVINKQRPLPAGYAPPDLRTPVVGGQLRLEAATQLNALVAAARTSDINLKNISGYRSYEAQRVVYNNYVARDGRASADTYSARPGHSEHQTGWAVDLGTGTCDLQTCFGDTTTGKWLAAHAHEYGFIIRYLKGKDDVTGYQYEPWHLRYVGIGLAGKIHASGKTMEQYFGLPAAPSY